MLYDSWVCNAYPVLYLRIMRRQNDKCLTSFWIQLLCTKMVYTRGPPVFIVIESVSTAPGATRFIARERLGIYILVLSTTIIQFI